MYGPGCIFRISYRASHRASFWRAKRQDNVSGAIYHQGFAYSCAGSRIEVSDYFIRNYILELIDTIGRQLSYYPLAADPCFADDPLLNLAPQYGHATAIMCVPIPVDSGASEEDDSMLVATSPNAFSDEHSESIDHPSSSSMETSGGGLISKDFDDMQSRARSNDMEQEDLDPNWDVDARKYFSGSPIEPSGVETNFYHDPSDYGPDDALYPPSDALDYRLLARLTLDPSEEITPLALICVAQKSEMYSAIVSALFQREAWGITDPLMGISFDRMGTTICLVLGWLEERDDSCVRLPFMTPFVCTNMEISRLFTFRTTRV